MEFLVEFSSFFRFGDLRFLLLFNGCGVKGLV